MDMNLNYKKSIYSTILLLFLISPIQYPSKVLSQNDNANINSDNTFKSLQIYADITPDGEASFEYQIDIIKPINKDILIPKFPWRYELTTWYNLVTPFFGHTVKMETNSIIVEGFSNSSLKNININITKESIVIPKDQLMNIDKLNVRYKVENFVSDLPPFYSFVIGLPINANVNNLQISIYAHSSWIIRSYDVECFKYNQDLSIDNNQLLETIYNNDLTIGYNTIKLKMYQYNLTSNKVIEIDYSVSQLPLIGQWGEAKFWLLAWSLFILIVIFGIGSNIKRLELLPKSDVYVPTFLSLFISINFLELEYYLRVILDASILIYKFILSVTISIYLSWLIIIWMKLLRYSKNKIIILYQLISKHLIKLTYHSIRFKYTNILEQISIFFMILGFYYLT
jgi:hypothetical protein